MKQTKPKKCKECGNSFTPYNSFQKCCGVDCAIAYAATHTKKEVAKEKRKALKSFSDRDIPTLKRLAQTVFNKYIRLRDSKLPCVSCGYVWNSEGGRKKNAGHFMSQGGNSALRYDERNVHLQCEQCNTYLNGNLAEYRKELINRIGLDQVIELETTKTPKRWTAEELHEIISTYKAKIKDIK